MSPLWLLALTLAGQQTEFTGTVVHVHDGDTAHVKKEDGTIVKVRFVYCDAPEIDQPRGIESREFVKELCWNKPVTVVSSGLDEHGRTLGEIFVGETSVNKEVIRNGHGWWFYHYHPDAALGELEVEARAGMKGLFADEAPIYPRAWRRGARIDEDGGGADGGDGGGDTIDIESPVFILALLPDPIGSDDGNETVILGNGSGADISIDQWELADDDGDSFPLSGEVPAGGSRTIRLSDSLRLGNDGDTVVLKNPQGDAVQSVTYDAARRARFVVVSP